MDFHHNARRALRRLAFGSCSLLALHAAPALAQTTTTPSTSGVVKPMYGNISPFYGNISPFYGNIHAFYGNISPFYGNISPFYGNISAFYGNINPFVASTNPMVTALYSPTGTDGFWGAGSANPYTHNPSPNVNFSQLQGFWTTEETSYTAVMKAWSSAQTAADYQKVADLLQTTVLDPAGSFWGKAVQSPPPKVGQRLVPVPASPAMHGASDVSAGSSLGTFGLTVSDKFLTAAGVTFNSDGSIDASSLADVSQTQQAVLFLGLYDNLMGYTGAGHVDWWMGATGWSPYLASVVASGYRLATPITIGMLDFSVSPTGVRPQGTLTQYGSSVYNDGHGAAVASLIMGSVDGTGILGVMPAQDAKVITYNPYDSTGTTNWTAVGQGVQTLTNTISNLLSAGSPPVGVINASLGVPGWTLNPGWNTALSTGAAAGHILVIAAGNDGVAQTQDVPWNTLINPTLLIVGSVGVNGQISNFSNTPGTACLRDTITKACDPLANHFLVAPGELILVSDGAGNVSRQTGTSLAAPLVSGAVALLQARWPWLGYFPNETAQIILQSATPMGTRLTNPNQPDPVYGWGELNIAASQAPLNWNSLVFYKVSGPGLLGVRVPTPVSLSQVVSTIQTGSQASWNAQNLYFTAIEPIGRTFRDFEIPMSASLVGQSVLTVAGQQQFQSYLSLGLQNWVAGGAHFAGKDADDAAVMPGMLGFTETSAPVGKVGGMDLRLKMTPSETVLGYKANNLPMNTEFALTGTNGPLGASQALRFGYGEGAAALGGQDGFADKTDYDPVTGGANALLGLASGGAFADYRMAFTKHLSFDVGVTDRRSVRDINVFGAAEQSTPSAVYAATAEHFGVNYAPISSVVLHASYTHLHEDTGLLGVQSMAPGALQNGSNTSGVSLGFDLGLTRSLMLSMGGTVARTDSGPGQTLQTAAGGLVSSSAEVALSKTGVFAPLDRLRLTLSKPMQVNAGRVQFIDYGVTDRSTGALGLVTETVGAANNRTPFAAEMLYGRLLSDRRTEFSLLLRASANTDQFAPTVGTEYMAGGKYKLVF